MLRVSDTVHHQEVAFGLLEGIDPIDCFIPYAHGGIVAGFPITTPSAHQFPYRRLYFVNGLFFQSCIGHETDGHAFGHLAC